MIPSPDSLPGDACRGQIDGCEPTKGAHRFPAFQKKCSRIASGVSVWIATGHTDMRRGMNSGQQSTKFAAA